MGLIINPGSGPVRGADVTHAAAAVEQFVLDLHLDGVTTEFVADCGDGRFEYALRLGERETVIEMPGRPVDVVRYLREPGQNIWNFPRLYVDGSSWVWAFAIGCARDALVGDEESA